MEKEREVGELKDELKDLINSRLDYAQISRINTIIKKLNEMEPEERIMEREEGWIDFKNKYLSKNNGCKAPLKKRAMSSILVPTLIFICVSVASVMAGVYFLEPAIKHSKDILNLSTYDSYTLSEDNTKYFKSIKSLENYIGKKFSLPRYMPEECKTEAIGLFDDGSITITYLIGDQKLKYNIFSKENVYDISLEKTDEETETLIVNNKNFFIFKNKKWLLVYWNDSEYLYYIKTSIPKDELIKIINSIE